MPRSKYYPDYAALYPDVEIPGKVLKALRQSDRKMKYAEYDLKAEDFVADAWTGFAAFIPSREDSLERLLEVDKQFLDESATPEDQVEKALYIQELRRCIALLDEKEHALIQALYFDGLSEQKYGKMIGLSQKNVNKHKRYILCKMEKILKSALFGV